MDQATAQTSTPAPNAPATLQAPGSPVQAPAVVTSTGVILTPPTTRAELSALRAQREEMSDQLQSAANRREGLAKDLTSAEASARPGIQARIDQLDQRILQLESDIEVSGRLLITGQGAVQGTPNSSPFNFPGDLNMNFTAVSVIFTLFVLMPIAVTIARLVWRRGSRSPGAPQLERENADRLARLETSVDAIAIEMERVSEGQRFVTKLLSESRDRVRLEASRD